MTKVSNAFSSFLHSPGWVLLFATLFSTAYFIFAHEGFYWIDDYGYAKYAWQVAEGTFSITPTIHPSNPLTHRPLTFAPVAVFYKLFGINIYTTTLWPLICTLGCSWLIYFLFRKENPKVAVAGIILFSLYFYSLFFGSYLYSDNILMFFAFASVAVFYRFRYQTDGRKPVLYAFLFVSINFAAYLSKETILYYAPFYLFLFALDFFQKKHTTFWVYAILFGILILGANFAYYHFRTGNWFFRFQLYEQSNIDYQTGDNAEFIPVEGLFPRLTYKPLYFFMGTGIMIPFLLALGMVRNNSFRKLINLRTRENFWLLLALLTLLQFWFSSTAFGFYKPVPLLPRFITVLMPPLCLCAAFGLLRFWQKDQKLTAFYTLAFLTVCFFDRSNTLVMYVILTTYFAWNWWKSRTPDYKPAFALGAFVLIITLSLRPLHFMYKPSLMSFQEEHKIVKNYLNQESGKNLVIGDRWQNFMYDFHYQFEPNPHYTYKMFNEAGTDFSAYNRVYLLVNRSNISNPDMASWQLVKDPEINTLFPQKKLITREGNVLLYQLK